MLLLQLVDEKEWSVAVFDSMFVSSEEVDKQMKCECTYRTFISQAIFVRLLYIIVFINKIINLNII